MSAFRLYSKLDTFYGETGELLAGGYLRFYAAGTTTDQDVFGEKALATNNGSQVALDASGRPVHDIWADTSNAYFVELYDADDVKQGEADNVEIPGGTSQAVPVPDTDEFLTGDGTTYSVEDLSDRLVPDPTGQADKVLSTDGTSLTWIAKPADGADGTSDTSDTSTTFKVGDFLVQTGSDSAPASSSKSTTKAVTFATAYDAAPLCISIEPTTGGPTPSGVFPKWAITTRSASGFTVEFNTKTGGTSADNQSGSDITSAVTFKYAAFGIKA
jgi:hypothetical protein